MELSDRPQTSDGWTSARTTLDKRQAGAHSLSVCLGATAMIIFAPSGNRTPNQGRQGHNLVIAPNASQQSQEMPSLESINQDTTEIWPGSSVGIVTCYRLDGPGSRWGKIVDTHPDRSWDPPRILYNWYRSSLRGDKAAGTWG